MSEKKTIVVVPARGGSKRFPGKNTHPLLGIPLVAHPIIAAKKAKLVDRIIVSTDDERIAKVAQEYGAEFPFSRPAELATETSKVVETITYTLRELEKKEGYHADYAVLLQPSTPIIEPEQIDTAIQLAYEKNADSVVTVSEVDTINHPYNVREILADGSIKFWHHDLHYNCVSNDRPKFYHAANLWLSSYDTVIKEGKLEGRKNYPVILPEIYSSDIDFKEDLERIEAILMQRQSR
ncbi:acylneuraminate cytidylyltransferase family protein [Candidatus Kaiserbacteria bacterium]|nr:acylneuraminate cytidylyltransferase family protein [Candidatus Kaiserbacteria bacterium]